MKNNELLLEVIGETDDAMIPDMHTANANKPWRKWTAIGGGVCAAAVIGGVLLLHGGNRPDPPDVDSGSSFGDTTATTTVTTTSTSQTTTATTYASTPPTTTTLQYHNGKPMLEVSVDTHGNGFESIMLYDSSELESSNPWQAITATELPVYRNLTYCTDYPRFSGMIGLSQAEMEQKVEHIAAALGTTVTSKEVHYIKDIVHNSLSEELAESVYMLSAHLANGVDVQVEADGTVSMDFDPDLPDGYVFAASMSEDEAQKTLLYFARNYADMLQYDAPTGFTEFDRNIYGAASRRLMMYDRADDPVQNLLHYCLGSTWLASGKLWQNNLLEAAEYVDDYPIITADDAKKLLLNGQYLTTVPTEYILGDAVQAEHIVSTELVYRAVQTAAYYQPYYKFYVLLGQPQQNPDEYDPKLQSYGAFYVPAVTAEYLLPIAESGLTFN